MRKRLIWKVVPGFLAVIVLATVSVAWYAGHVVRQAHEDQVALALLEKASLLAPSVLKHISTNDSAAIDQLCNQYGESGGMRVTFILPDGQVLGDSDRDPAVMDNHRFRPEIAEALNGDVGRSSRFSRTVGQQLLYIARPIESSGKLVGVLRTSIPLADMNKTLNALYVRIGLGGLLVTVLAAVLGFIVFERKISRPLRSLEKGALRFADGDLSQPLPVSDSEEIATFATALNQMAKQLDERIRAATQQSQEQQAVLASMVEGVIAIDSNERVITINVAAAQWMDVDLLTAHGRKSYEVIRNLKLQDLLARALDSGMPVAYDLTLRGEPQRLFLHAQAAPIHDDLGSIAGVVVVLHDVTRLRHLEAVRQEFVANVSHELKTPIAAIKGAVETILDDLGISEETSIPRSSQSVGHDTSDNTSNQLIDDEYPSISRFLPVIARQAERLNSIVEDLLTLARIEADEQDQQLSLELNDIEAVLLDVVETCQSRADEKSIQLTVTTPDNLLARINPPLILQAVVNLLDNAIKYSAASSHVKLTARRDANELVIEVVDNGPGIEKTHLSRIFERFYRTDQARSRALGGTGLGLAIVKHVAQAHRGRVSVDSVCGSDSRHGSTFRIHLPS